MTDLKRHGLALLVGGLAAVAAVTPAHADIELNGFGSFFYNQSTNPDFLGSYSRNQYADFASLTRFGLNVGSKISDHLTVASQFVVDGGAYSSPGSQPAWGLRANWAYLSWNAAPGLNVKLGRQLFPNWLAAEFTDVGYLQPYIRGPQGVFTMSPFKNFEGLLIDYTADLGFAKLTPAIFGGVASRDFTSYSSDFQTDISNLAGGAVTLNGDGFRVRGMISGAMVRVNSISRNVSPPAPGYPDVASNIVAINGQVINTLTATVGASYDKNNIVVWTEYGKLSGNGGQINMVGPVNLGQLLKDIKGGYALGGYRFGKFMPYVMYSQSDWTQAGFGLGKEKDTTIGLNYAATPGAIVKLAYLTESTDDGLGAFVSRSKGDATAAHTVMAGVDFIF